MIALEVSLGAGLLASVGPRLVSLTAVAVIVGVIHPVMAWVTAREPMAVALYLRSLWWADYYPPHAGLRARRRRRPTLPALS